jgi:hypothetical protein
MPSVTWLTTSCAGCGTLPDEIGVYGMPGFALSGSIVPYAGS